ncbi:MAG TPA: thymidylate synthase [Anaerolineaceae bacterium]
MAVETIIEAQTLGTCWLRVSRRILERGALSQYDGTPTRELANLSLVITAPDPADELIRRLGDPVWLDWMHANFFSHADVAELGNAASYAVRLFDYARQGRDQIAWVTQRLKADPNSRSATITTFMPLSDTSYIPCISLLDFWIPGEALELVVYAHSLDFGKKAYGNLVELASLMQQVAKPLGRPVGKLLIHVKSAHIYEPERGEMRKLCNDVYESVGGDE